MKKVVVCDDDEDIITLVALLLDTIPVEYSTIRELNDAVSQIHAEQPDLILMDLKIPVMGGEKAVDLLKNDESTSHIPVLLFSANDDIAYICKECGADGFISKPFEIGNFKAKLVEHLA